MQKLMEMKKYLEHDEVQLLLLTESTLTKLGTMTDEKFGQASGVIEQINANAQAA